MTGVLSDTGQMVMLTGRTPATIRWALRDHRQPGGYNHDTCAELLAAHPDVPVVSAAEAGRLPGIGVPANRIYQWVHAGLLRPVDRDGRSPLYAVDDLVRLRNRLDRKAQLDL